MAHARQRSRELTLHLSYVPNEITNTYIGGVALLAAWRGDWRARAISGCQVATIAVGYYAEYGPFPHNPATLPKGRWLIEDVAMLAICLAASLHARRYWPIWASSFALLLLITDLTLTVNPNISFWEDVAASYVWRILTTAAVFAGLWPSLRRRKSSTP